MTDDRAGHSLWGGRFGEGLDPAIHDFTNSLPFDRRLVRHDLVGSLAHARGLYECGVLAPDDARAVLGGLSDLLRDVEENGLEVEGPDEDVHSWIERALRSRIGEAGGRLHAGRSRNDQTAVALRLWTREAVATSAHAAVGLAEVWMEQASDHLETLLPGYTHLQRGQPITLAHHLLAHAWALLADAERLSRVHEAAGTSPLGAGALAGSPFPLDLHRTCALLGLRSPHPNSLLAVSDRDYVAEAVFAFALLQVHLSRWAEEMVLWASREFGFVTLGDRVAQGSSLMPQKRNPEAAELVRGKAGRTIGRLAGLLATLKSLPFAYNSDLQEDKEALFDAADTGHGSLVAAAAFARGVEFRADRMRAALDEGFPTATDLADALVRRGLPFREAHERAGRAVREAEARGCGLQELPADVLETCCPGLDADEARAVLDPEEAVRARRLHGGPAPAAVQSQLEAARSKAAGIRRWLEGLEAPPIERAHLARRLMAESIP